MCINSVEDGNAHEHGAKKSHLSLPVRGRKIDQRTSEYRRTVSNSFRDTGKKEAPKPLEGARGAYREGGHVHTASLRLRPPYWRSKRGRAFGRPRAVDVSAAAPI